MRHRNVLIGIFIIAITVRILFFIWAYVKVPISSEEAWVGAMSMGILRGEFPIVYWGQTYMGTQQSFIDAPLVFLFGAKAISIRVYPFVFGLLFIYLSYLLARQIYNKDVALLTVILLAVPSPYILMTSVMIPPDNHLAIITLGSLALLITSSLVFTENPNKKAVKYALLGFILGYSFWLHILIINYIVVILFFLFLKDKLLIFRRNFWLFLLSFIIGSFPIIWHNITHDFSSFYLTYGTSLNRAMWNLRNVFTKTSHFVLGLRVMLYGDNWNYIDLPAALIWLTSLVLTVLVLIVLVLKFKNIWRICILSLRNVHGTAMLFAIVFISIYVYCRSGRSHWWSTRYLLPVMSALPILFAYGLWEIKKKSKFMSCCFLSIILTANIWGCIYLTKAWGNPDIVANKLDLPDMTSLKGFLKEQGIKHAYAHYWISYRLTYETNEEVICSQPFNDRFDGVPIPFIEGVRNSKNTAYILYPNFGIKPEIFEDYFKIIGGTYKKKGLDKFTVFYSFVPPYKDNDLLEEIPSTDWQVSSNFNTGQAYNAVDRDINTRWGSASPQKPKMYYNIDLGKKYFISKIRFDLGKFLSDCPHGIIVYTSLDNNNWEKAINIPKTRGCPFWDKSHPVFWFRNDYFSISFEPVKARYIKVEQTSYDRRHDWSIAELYIYSFPRTKRDPTKISAWE